LGGNGVPLNLAFDIPYFLEITVGGEILAPRLVLTSSAYSMSSRSIVGTGNVFPSSGDVGIGTTSPTTELDVSGTVKATSFEGEGSGLTDVDAISLQGNAVSSTGPSDGQVLKWNNTGSTWEPATDEDENNT